MENDNRLVSMSINLIVSPGTSLLTNPHSYTRPKPLINGKEASRATVETVSINAEHFRPLYIMTRKTSLILAPRAV